jgi:hypothetical protein
MNGRFVLDFYATPATKSARPTLAEYRHRIPDVEAQTVHCGQDTFQTDLADTAIDVVIMMTNDRPSRIRRDPSTHHSMRGRIRKLLRSTGLVVALSSFLLLPMPVTGIVFDPAAYADPYTGAIPKWVRSACCGPADVHRLAMGQVREVELLRAVTERVTCCCYAARRSAR